MTSLDRENWSWRTCTYCRSRKCQLTIDLTPKSRLGTYIATCWQCYWHHEVWRRGPIINCGPAWDGLDVRRDYLK